MSSVNGIIKAPISFNDVNRTLGTTHTDEGALVKDVHIKKWARYKPFKSSLIGIPTEVNRQDARYGLNPPQLKTGQHFNMLAYKCMIGLVDSSVNKGGLWDYVKPDGGANGVYRIHDFVNCDNPSADGYNHGATQPPCAITLSGVNENLHNDGNGIFELNLSNSGNVDVVMQSIPNSNIPLWAFLQRAYNTYNSGNGYRMSVGVYVDDGLTRWYERSVTESGLYNVSDVFTWESAVSGITRTVRLDFTGKEANTGKIYYVVIGFQKISADKQTISPDDFGGGNGILPPWEDSELERGYFSFLKRIKLVSYFDRVVKFGFNDRTVGWGQSSWFTYANAVFNGRYTSGALWLECDISRNGVALAFVKSTTQHNGNLINFGVSVDGGQTIVELEPMTTRAQVAEAIEIPETNISNQYTHLKMAGAVLPEYSSNMYFTMYIYTRQYQNGESPSSKNWVISTTLAMHYT